MGRDRDPFDRTISYMREHLASWPPLQGAVISINGLAHTLDVSQTPVREALATLAGEGLIVRTPAGYAGATYDPATLAAHYNFAGLLAIQMIRSTPLAPLGGDETHPSTEVAMGVLAELAGDRVVREAARRVAAQLAPFAAPANAVLGDGARNLSRLLLAWRGGDHRALLGAVRDHHARRRRAAARILAAAIGLGTGR